LSTNLGHKIHIVTVYQSVKLDSIHTVYQQQQHILLNKGITQPNPQTQLLHDLSVLLNQWNKLNNQTIICIDANDALHTNKSLLSRFLSDKPIIRLIQNPAHYPPPHVSGSTYINFICDSTSLLTHVMKSGLTQFFSAPFEWSDHQGLFLDLVESSMFGASLHTPIPSKHCTITYKSS
jgi:hypothetical protein